MGCASNMCRKEPNSLTTEYLFYPNDKSDIKFIQNNSKINNSYDLLSKEFFYYLNEIRLNPDKYVTESKQYNLFEIFMNLKPCTEINYVENNTEMIKRYIINSHFKKKGLFDQEKDIKILLGENIKDLCLFQTVCLNKNMKENIWLFFGENEDDIDKIFDKKYNNLIIICIPLEINTKILLSLIFYKV